MKYLNAEVAVSRLDKCKRYHASPAVLAEEHILWNHMKVHLCLLLLCEAMTVTLYWLCLPLLAPCPAWW